jgi:poly-gamma-glutamate capsule biosynthesis protein CapA/YwtB (metallophosphatase superfamily)
MPRIAFLGDTLLGGDAEETLRHHGYGYALADVCPVLEDADVVVANQEGPITRHDELADKPGDKNWWYRAQPESLSALTDAGVRVVSLGNNHILDYGQRGLEETLAALDAIGIAYCGAGRTEADARRPALREVSGMRPVSCQQWPATRNTSPETRTRRRGRAAHSCSRKRRLPRIWHGLRTRRTSALSSSTGGETIDL